VGPPARTAAGGARVPAPARARRQDPADLPIVSRALAAWDRPNFQVAIDAWSAGREVDVVGLPGDGGLPRGLAELVRGTQWGPSLELGAVEYVTVPLGEHESIACVESGFWLARGDEGPLVVNAQSSEPHGGEP
jgi:hypothetical protein